MWTGLLVACACVLAAPAAALAEVRSGSATDPTGDVPGVPPHQDLTAAEASYDTAGTVTAKVTMASAPDAANPALTRLILGRLDGADCRNVLYLTVTAPSGPAETTTDAGGSFAPPTLSQAGNVLSIQATDGQFANLPFDCVDVVGGNPPNLLQDDIPNIPLKAAAPPPAPAPPPPATKPPASKRKPSAKLKRAIRSCKRQHKSSKRSAKRKRARCISRARKKYGRVR